jgi:hypothetical protein
MFFHRKAAGRGKKNKIELWRKDDGMITKVKKEMEGMTTTFFHDLYTADPSVAPEVLVQLFRPIITEEMNSLLCKEFSDDEIGDALF